MIGLDTNVVVRYVMQDDEAQSRKATALIESLTNDEPGFLSIVAVVELVWVLSESYGLTREQQVRTLEILLRIKEIVVDRADHVLKALRVFQSTSADFADCLIQCGAASTGCERTMTFDVSASIVAGMTLIR